MNPPISILVPIYNVSSHIEQCAHSLFCQTFWDIEYVFVNDGTPDNSMLILERVMEQYPHRRGQVKIINHVFNRGLAAARNSAIDNSSGRYIIQVDSDDFVEPDFVEMLYSKAQETDADIIVCDFFNESKRGYNVVSDAIFDDINQNRSSVIASKESHACVWNKLIKRELYNRCYRLPEGLNFGEDKYMVIQLYFLTDRIAKVNKPLYHYGCDNPTSFTLQKRSRKHFENTFQCWDFLSLFLKERNADLAHQTLLNLEKVKRKASLMIATNQYAIRKEFALKWYNEEIQHLSELKRGKRIITVLVRRRLFVAAHLYHYGVCLCHWVSSLF